MSLKEGQYQQNATGFTMKTRPENLSKWRHDINEWFLSLLNCTGREKDVCEGVGRVVTYTTSGDEDGNSSNNDSNNNNDNDSNNNNNDFTFTFYPTGRVTIQTDNVDELRDVFLDHIEVCLGTAMTEIPERRSNNNIILRRSLMPGLMRSRSESNIKPQQPQQQPQQPEQEQLELVKQEVVELTVKMSDMKNALEKLRKENDWLLQEVKKKKLCEANDATKENTVDDASNDNDNNDDNNSLDVVENENTNRNGNGWRFAVGAIFFLFEYLGNGSLRYP